MGRAGARRSRRRGASGVLAIVSCVGALLGACGEVTTDGAQIDQTCAKKVCTGKDCPPTADDKAPSAGAGCATGKGGAGGGDPSGGAGGAGATTGGGGAAPTEVAEFACTVCRRAENCCKAEGLTDCGYTAACASAKNAQQMQFYVVLCRAVLSTAPDGTKRPADSCGF